jgi:hypothetical protein
MLLWNMHNADVAETENGIMRACMNFVKKLVQHLLGVDDKKNKALLLKQQYKIIPIRQSKITAVLVLTALLTACVTNPVDHAGARMEVPAEKVTLTHNPREHQDAFNELDVELGLKSAMGRVKTIVGNGYGNTVDQSRRDALNNLAGSIQVDVVKEVNTCTNQQGDCGSVVKVNTRSELPILGVQYQRLANAQGMIHFQAWIDSQYSLPIYVRELDQLSAKIKKQSQLLQQNLNASQRYRLISDLVAYSKQYDKKRLVANILGGYRQQARPDVDINALSAELKQLEHKASSLAFAAEVLVKHMAEKNIYLHPPRPKNIQEVTPFASAIKEHMSPFLDTVSLSEKAEYNMEGEYEILNNGDIYLSYRLVDLNYKVINSHSVIVEKTAHQAFRSKPSSVSFETLLHNNVAINNEFRAELKTIHGANTLYYQQGDMLKLLVRLNQAGYYYIVGHVVREGEQFSYLLNLNNGYGNDMFIRYIAQDQANKYIEIAEFEVNPPYGAEHLQLIASNKEFTRLPAYSFMYRAEDSVGYYALKGSQGNASAGVEMTRALRLKQNKNEVLTSEATLTYTSRPQKFR